VLTDWQVNGNAQKALNNNVNVLRLTPSKSNQKGSAFIQKAIPLVENNVFKASFSAFFSFQFTANGGQPNFADDDKVQGADGVVFVIQTISNTVGTDGYGIGYKDIPKSIGIEFDTFKNDSTQYDAEDPDGNHIGININGIMKSRKTRKIDKRMSDGNRWFAWVDYNGDKQVLEVRLDTTEIRPTVPSLSDTLNIPLILEQKDAFVGFTSATGSNWNNHDILSFSFINKFSPPNYTLAISAQTDKLVMALDTVTLNAKVFDNLQQLHDSLTIKTQWQITNVHGNSLQFLGLSIGASTRFVPTDNDSIVLIKASVKTLIGMIYDSLSIRVHENVSLSLKALPDTMVYVNDTVQLCASILNHSLEEQSELSENVQWYIIDSGNNPQTILKKSTGSKVPLIPTVGNTRIVLGAKYIGLRDTLQDTIAITVRNLTWRFFITAPDTVAVLDSANLTAHFKDNLNRDDFSTLPFTKWRILNPDGNPLTILKNTTGMISQIIPQVAYSTVIIEGSLSGYTDTVSIYVKPGPPYQISIEADTVIENIVALRSSQSISTIKISGQTDTAHAYAIVRDRSGAFCRLASKQTTEWNALFESNPVISVKAEDNLNYHGIISRIRSQGVQKVWAGENGLINDTVNVLVEPYWYTKLRLIDKNTNDIVTSIKQDVNESRNYEVYGLRSNASDESLADSWELVPLQWTLSTSINTKIAAPMLDYKWNLIALNQGTGQLSLAYQDMAHKVSAIIPVQIVNEAADPRIIAATFDRSGSSEENRGLLTLTFNVPVNVKLLSDSLLQNALNVFEYSSSRQYSTSEIFNRATISLTSDSLFVTKISINLTSGSNKIVGLLDSIKLVGGTISNAGKFPNPEIAPYVPITTEGASFTISHIPLNSKAHNGSDISIRKLSEFYNTTFTYGNNGILASVYTDASLRPEINGKYYGRAKIYDALGNLVAIDLPIEPCNGQAGVHYYSVKWNGTNLSKRNVANGTYLIAFKFTDTNNRPHILKHKIYIAN
jgi:hypothetical protein